MSDQPGKPEDGDSTSGESAMPEPDLLKADDVHLADPEVSADAVEPVLDTSPDEVHLSDPALSAAEISGESAKAASLDEAAAEAESVAREAGEVGTLVAGAAPAVDPAAAAAPSGTAPAGGAAGDGTDEDTAGGDAPAGLASFASSVDAPAWTGQPQEQSRWDALFEAEQSAASEEAPDTATAETPGATADAPGAPAENPGATAGHPGATAGNPAPEAPWAQPFPAAGPTAPGSPVPPVPPVGGPYGLPPAGANEPAPKRLRARAVGGSSRASNRKKLILGLVALVVLALLIFAVTSIVNALRSDDSESGSSPSTTPGADGIIAENISPLELAAGACILGFDSAEVSADVTTVTCSTPHNAQLLATTSLPEDADFPGEAALNASGDDLCNAVPIDENAAAEYQDLTLTQVTPTSGTWAEGDRRIDCFVVSGEGNVITDTLLSE